MKTNKRTNAIDQVMNEYVNWGGPVITREMAREDCIAKGYDWKAIDMLVFGRQAVEAPENVEAHVAFHRQIQAMGW